MMVENIIQIAIPIIGIVTAIISASLSYYFTKRNQLDADERRLKEKYYLNYIQAVSDIVLTSDIEHAKSSLAEAQNQLLLIASDEVVLNLMNFHDYVKPSAQEKHGFSNKEHDKL